MGRAPFQVTVIPFRQTRSGNGEYAVFQRADAGYWQGIAGGGEDGESPTAAARREAFEEAGIPPSAPYFRLDTTAAVSVANFRARTLWPRNLYVIPCHCFAVDATGIEIVLSREHTAYRWCSYAEGAMLLHWDSDKTALWELNERLLNGDLPVRK